MQRMHGPEDEKRSIVIVPDDQRVERLHARVPEQRQGLLRMFEAEEFVDVPVVKQR